MATRSIEPRDGNTPTIALALLGIVLVLLSTFSPSTHAASAADHPHQRIVIPLENILVHGIPKANQPLFDPKEIITVDTGKPLYFVARPLVRELITELLKSDYDVKIISDLPPNVAPKILSAITLPAMNNRSLDQLVEFEQVDLNKPLDVTSFAKDGKRPLLVAWEGMAAKPAEQVLNLGPVYFIYPDFKVLEEHRIASGKFARFFPKTPSEWVTERQKLGRLSLLLREANRDNLGTYNAKIKDLLAEDQEHLTLVGSQILSGTFKPSFVKWDVNPQGDKVVGCALIETRHKKPLGPASIEVCRRDLGIVYVFKKDNDRAKVVACEERTTDGKALLGESDSFDACLKNSSEVTFAFEGVQHDVCRAFTKQAFEIQVVSTDRCSDYHSLYSQNSRRWIVFKAFVGMEKLGEAKLLSRVESPPPTKKEPLRVYEPWNDQHSSNNNFGQCLANGWQTMKTEANGRDLAKECRTDTLYSWGDQAKIDALKKLIGKLPSWRPIKTLYTSRGPLTTFGYGPIPIRIKLRPGVRFVKSDYVRCDFEADKHRNTVYFRSDALYSDWTFCDPDVIHSWSHSTPEHYDEIIKDIRLHNELQMKHTPLVGHIEIYAAAQRSGVFFGGPLDGHYFTANIFVGFLGGLQDRIEKDMGEIFFNPELPAQERTRESHFKTAAPTHFNEM